MHQHVSNTALWRAMHDAIAELLQPRSDRARAQIDRTQPRAALGGVLQYALLQPRDLWPRLTAALTWPILSYPLRCARL